MSPYDQARNYIKDIPGAVSGNGGHNQTFSVAMCLVEGFALSAIEARPLMAEYAARCDPRRHRRWASMRQSATGGILRRDKESNINAFLADEAWAFHEYHNRGGHDEIIAALQAASCASRAL